MFIDSLFFILIVFLFIVILISIAFYNRVRIRTYYRSNSATGDIIVPLPAIDPTYYKIFKDQSTGLDFYPLYEDRKSSISGRIVLLVYNPGETYFMQSRIVNEKGTVCGGPFVSEITEGMSYFSLYFKAPPGDDRNLGIESRKYDNKKQQETGEIISFNLVQAYAWYV